MEAFSDIFSVIRKFSIRQGVYEGLDWMHFRAKPDYFHLFCRIPETNNRDGVEVFGVQIQPGLGGPYCLWIKLSALDKRLFRP
jgi:hypothetical protein